MQWTAWHDVTVSEPNPCPVAIIPANQLYQSTHYSFPSTFYRSLAGSGYPNVDRMLYLSMFNSNNSLVGGGDYPYDDLDDPWTADVTGNYNAGSTHQGAGLDYAKFTHPMDAITVNPVAEAQQYIGYVRGVTHYTKGPNAVPWGHPGLFSDTILATRGRWRHVSGR